MRVAVAVFNTRVSPRFDCAPAFVIATVEDGAVQGLERIGTMGNGPTPGTERDRHLCLGVGGVGRRGSGLRRRKARANDDDGPRRQVPRKVAVPPRTRQLRVERERRR